MPHEEHNLWQQHHDNQSLFGLHQLCLIMHLIHTNRAPQYLADCVQTIAQSSSRRGLRSADTATCAVSKLYSSREHIVTNSVSAPGRLY